MLLPLLLRTAADVAVFGGLCGRHEQQSDLFRECITNTGGSRDDAVGHIWCQSPGDGREDAARDALCRERVLANVLAYMGKKASDGLLVLPAVVLVMA